MSAVQALKTNIL